MHTPEQLVPEHASILGVRMNMPEQELRARFGDSLCFLSETAEVGGKSEAWATTFPDNPGELTICFMDGRVMEVYWILKADGKEIAELSKAIRARLKSVYGCKPVGADKVYRSETPLDHHAWTTRWGNDPTYFKLGMYRGPGRD